MFFIFAYASTSSARDSFNNRIVWGGYDAMKDEVVSDMIEAGIVDPVKVTRGAVENAVSAAAILLTSEAAIADEPEEKKDTPPMPGGMDY